MESLNNIKRRFEIIGNDTHLNLSLEKAMRVAPTDISVLVTGESGVGKESIPKIVHHLSHRKHANYIAVNCGAIPEGTIDSELFGHEKGAFTGAVATRKGYFEVADGGTIFLDEVGELPLTTQVRLLRVLETGEFIKVGSSKTQKTNVRIVAATNLDMQTAIRKEKFREDLFYRLSTIEIHIPSLRKRENDIHLLFRKFAAEFAEKYKMPTVRLTEAATQALSKYPFPGNVRQLRNIAEQLSVVEEERVIGPEKLLQYLPNNSRLPAIIEKDTTNSDFAAERDIIYKILFDMRNDINELKKLSYGMSHNDFKKSEPTQISSSNSMEVLEIQQGKTPQKKEFKVTHTIEQEPSLSLEEQEIEMIKKVLKKYRNKRKFAAKELGISERTLYRKIKQYDL